MLSKEGSSKTLKFPEIRKVGNHYQGYLGILNDFYDWHEGLVTVLQKLLDDVNSDIKELKGHPEVRAELIGKKAMLDEFLLLLGVPNLKCPDCGTLMVIGDVRDDSCQYFTCPKCGCDVAEETEEWFKKMGV